MEPTQTQKPIIVKDNLGAEVFSVDTDGTIFPAPPTGEPLNATLTNIANNVEVMTHEIIAEQVSIGDDAGYGNFDHFAKWRFDFNSQDIEAGGELPRVEVMFATASGFLKASSGSYEILMLESLDNEATYDIVSVNRVLLSGDETTYEGEHFQEPHNSNSNYCADRIFGNSCFIALGHGEFFGGGGTMAVKDYKLHVEVILPSGATMTKVI